MAGFDEVLAGLGFPQVVLLWPVLTLLHVVEEWPGFPVWARRFASPAHSDREYVVPAVYGWLAHLAVRDGIVTPRWLGAAMAVALLGHVADVGQTVFERW